MSAKAKLTAAAVWLAPVLFGAPPLWPIGAAVLAFRIAERMLWSAFGLGALAVVIILAAVAARSGR
jgi:hypothetical protein